MITIYYTKFEKQLDKELLQYYLQLLPSNQLERNQKFYRWQDQHAHLLGRLLLHHGWQNYEPKSYPLQKLQYTAYNRPFIVGEIDFNISHAGNYVLCAIGTRVKLGIDIEECKQINLEAYKMTMRETEWTDIVSSPFPIDTFYHYWSKKEAVLKADGRGLFVPLLSIKCLEDRAYINKNCWYLYNIPIASNYQTWLACDMASVNVHLQVMKFDTFGHY